jgi:hypothetical protein
MRVTVDKATLLSIHSLAIGASKDDITPVITQIALTREGDALRAMATDRYMVVTGLYTHQIDFEDWSEDDTILVDPKSLKAVVDIKKSEKFETVPTVIEKNHETGAVSAIVNTITKIDIGRVSGSFPAVMKLFPRETEPSGVPALTLKPDFLAKLAKVLPPELRPDRERAWNFEFRATESRNPAPVFAYYSGGSYKLEALIQPNLKR